MRVGGFISSKLINRQVASFYAPTQALLGRRLRRLEGLRRFVERDRQHRCVVATVAPDGALEGVGVERVRARQIPPMALEKAALLPDDEFFGVERGLGLCDLFLVYQVP
jgi:hypothetical protein